MSEIVAGVHDAVAGAAENERLMKAWAATVDHRRLDVDLLVGAYRQQVYQLLHDVQAVDRRRRTIADTPGQGGLAGHVQAHTNAKHWAEAGDRKATRAWAQHRDATEQEAAAELAQLQQRVMGLNQALRDERAGKGSLPSAVRTPTPQGAQISWH